jgi:sec-independent protein translocase protein TatA
MPFDVSIPELLIILVAVLLIFGPKRLPEMGRSLGRGLRQFRESVSGLDELTTTSTPTTPTRSSPAAEGTAGPTAADPAGTSDTDAPS